MRTPLFDLDDLQDWTEYQARLAANRMIWEMGSPENKALLDRLLTYRDVDPRVFNVHAFVAHMTTPPVDTEFAYAWCNFYFRVMMPLSRGIEFDQLALAYAYFRLKGTVDIFNHINQPREA